MKQHHYDLIIGLSRSKSIYVKAVVEALGNKAKTFISFFNQTTMKSFKY